jgi:hypothetical protein
MMFLVIVGFIAWMFWFLLDGPQDRAKRKKEAREFEAAQKARELDARAIRLLDRALVDPMYRQSTEWEDQAKALVDAYYGKGLKR